MLAAIACALAATPALAKLGALAPSEAVFPRQELPLRFSHALHLSKKIECDFCHDKAAQSKQSSDDLIPNEDTCSTCHLIEREHPEKTGGKITPCAACHPAGVDKRVVIPKPNLRFDHSAHVSRGIGCEKCHDVRKLELATRDSLPKMDSCLGCHDSGRGKLHAPSRCQTCHLNKPDGTLETRFPSGTLAPSGTLRGDAHTMEFRTNHAQVARDDEKYCLSCHRQDECLNCHSGVVKPFDFHGNDYISRHGIDARRDDPSCSACHRAQSFCLGCHERLGVTDIRSSPNSVFGANGTRTFHPPGWADPSAARNPNHHAWQAQRNLRTCTACHRQETCLECHGSATGIGQQGKMQVDPHPMGWADSPRCRALAERNARVCLRCHGVNDPQLHCSR